MKTKGNAGIGGIARQTTWEAETRQACLGRGITRRELETKFDFLETSIRPAEFFISSDRIGIDAFAGIRLGRRRAGGGFGGSSTILLLVVLAIRLCCGLLFLGRNRLSLARLPAPRRLAVNQTDAGTDKV